MFKIDIDEEVEKYNTKKDKLLNNLIERLNSFSFKALSSIGNINRAVADLNEKKEEHLQDAQKATLQINKLTKGE